MYTSYAVRLTAKRWTEQTRERCMERIDEWLERTHPPGLRPANVHVRERSDDSILRLVVEEQFTDRPSSRRTTVTLLPFEGSLAFEARVEHHLRRWSVLPTETPPSPDHALVDLVAAMTSMLESYDAGLRVTSTPHERRGTVDGQGLAALYEAPARTLPIVVECTSGKSPSAFLTSSLADELAGVAHVVHVADADCVAGLNDFAGAALVRAGVLTVLWPRPAAPTPCTERLESIGTIRAAIYAAAARIPALPVPNVDRAVRPRIEHRTAPAPMGESELAGLHERVARQREHIDLLDEELAQADENLEQLRSMQEELFDDLDAQSQTVEDHERTIAILKEQNLQLQQQRDSAIRVIVDGEDAVTPPVAQRIRTVADAIREAERLCPNLTFLPSAHETASALHGPNPQLLLKDLRKLNQVVGAWRQDKISHAGLHSYCRDVVRLDYVANISENTAQKHAAWYSTQWQGRPVLLAAHLRRGRGQYTVRVYMHVDTDSRTIVIGKVVRHGPDSTTG